MDIFIAYHGNKTNGSEAEAEKLYLFLNKVTSIKGEKLGIYFHPITGQGFSFGQTPIYCQQSRVFILVANDKINLAENGSLQEFYNGNRRRLYEEIHAFSESQNYRSNKKASARIVTSGNLSVEQAQLINPIFGGVEHFSLNDILNDPHHFIETLSSLLDKELIVNEISPKKNIFKYGELVEFGHWPKNTPIQWRCYSDTPGRMLLISLNSIDCFAYNNQLESCTWETSDLRAWLNTTFLENAFTDEEKKKIILTTFECEDNPKYLTKGGNSCTDYISIPSLHEVYYYLKPTNQHIKGATNYAITQGVFFNKENLHSTYWLRTPGYHNTGACVVDTFGYISRSGNGVNDNTNGSTTAIAR